MSRPPREPVVIDPACAAADANGPGPWKIRPYAEVTWQTWAVGIMLDLSVKGWRWVAVKVGPFVAGVEWGRWLE